MSREHAFESPLACVGCGKDVSHERATVDRHGWWHPACEQKAWDDGGRQEPVEAPFVTAWREAKKERIDPDLPVSVLAESPNVDRITPEGGISPSDSRGGQESEVRGQRSEVRKEQLKVVCAWCEKAANERVARSAAKKLRHKGQFIGYEGTLDEEDITEIILAEIVAAKQAEPNVSHGICESCKEAMLAAVACMPVPTSPEIRDFHPDK